MSEKGRFMHNQIEDHMTEDEEVDLVKGRIIEHLKREGALDKGTSAQYHEQLGLPPQIGTKSVERAISELKRDGETAAPEIAGPIKPGDVLTPRLYLTLALRD